MFNTKGLTLLCLAIAMLCATPQTTRAVLIDFEDIPRGTEYNSNTAESSIITTSGGQLFLRTSGGRGWISYATGRIAERSIGVPIGQAVGNSLKYSGTVEIDLPKPASSISFLHDQFYGIWINGQLSPDLISLTVDNSVQEFDVGSVHVVNQLIPGTESGSMFYAAGIINKFIVNSNFGEIDDIDITYIPEPATMLIMGTGLLLCRRRK